MMGSTAPTDHVGTFALDGNTFTYINDGDTGEDSFIVSITDEYSNTTTETIFIDVV